MSELDWQAVTVRLKSPPAEVDTSLSYVELADGRRVQLTETCAACGRRFERDDVAVTVNGAPFGHQDCDDPKLDKADA